MNMPKRAILMTALSLMTLLGWAASAAGPRCPAGFRPAPNTAAEPYAGTGWAKEIVHEKSGIEMVFIPAGKFLMGSPASEPERAGDEGPQAPVRIARPFYMGKHEITQAQWTRYMESNPSWLKDDGRLPVAGVMADECRDFLSKLNAGQKSRFRLPTEAEWEYACRAGTTGPFAPGAAIDAKQANCNGKIPYAGGGKTEYRRRPLPVGRFAPNAWGLHDMHGNVWELCATAFKPYPYDPADGREAPEAKWNVLRGGAWYCRPALCRSANRYIASHFRSPNVGLRIAYSLAP